MKIFLSYRFTGEDPKALKKTIRDIEDSLKIAGHSCFCCFWKKDFFNKNNFTNKQILHHALVELEKSDVYLAFAKSEDKSEGMLIEAGYALALKKKFYLAIKKDIKAVFLREIANKVIEFENLDELYKKLNKLK